MYGRASVLGLAIVGATATPVSQRTLAFTGFAVGWYVLAGLALVVIGLLLARAGRARRGDPRRSGSRILLAGAVAAAGVLLVFFPGSWRGLETIASAHTIGLVTGHTATAAPGAGVLTLYRGSSVWSVFALTGECTVAYVLAALLMGGAPLMLVRRLSALRVLAALGTAACVLAAVNLIRITAVGAVVLVWGPSSFVTGHTYLGSLVTFVGTCFAGVAFAVVLLRQGHAQDALAERAR